MTDGLTLHLDRVAQTLDRFFPTEAARVCAETGVGSTRALVDQRYKDMTKAQKFWLRHDLPLDTALLFIREDTAAWQRAHPVDLNAYAEFAQNAGWTKLGAQAVGMGGDSALQETNGKIAEEKTLDKRFAGLSAQLDKFYKSEFHSESNEQKFLTGLNNFVNSEETSYEEKSQLLKLLYDKGNIYGFHINHQYFDQLIEKLKDDIEAYEVDQSFKALRTPEQGGQGRASPNLPAA